jgi:hypothetical protein
MSKGVGGFRQDGITIALTDDMAERREFLDLAGLCFVPRIHLVGIIPRIHLVGIIPRIHLVGIIVMGCLLNLQPFQSGLRTGQACKDTSGNLH